MTKDINWDDVVEKIVRSKSFKSSLREKISENPDDFVGLNKKEIVESIQDFLVFQTNRRFATKAFRDHVLEANFQKHRDSDYYSQNIEFSIDDDKQVELLIVLINYYISDRCFGVKDNIARIERDSLCQVLNHKDKLFKISQYQQDLILKVFDFYIEAYKHPDIYMDGWLEQDGDGLGQKLFNINYKVSIQYNDDERYLCSEDLIYDIDYLRDMIENL